MIAENPRAQNHQILLKFWVASALTLPFVTNWARPAIAQTSLFSPEVRQKAEALLKQMTVEEKAGQLNQAPGRVMHGLGNDKPDAFIEHGKVGSVLWQFEVKEINRLQHIAVEKSRLHIPVAGELLRESRFYRSSAAQVNWPSLSERIRSQ